MMINPINNVRSGQSTQNQSKTSFGQGYITLNGERTLLAPHAEFGLLDNAAGFIKSGYFKLIGGILRNIHSKTEILELLPNSINIKSAYSNLEFIDNGKMDKATKELYDSIRLQLEAIQGSAN